jgi:hypothetical protein
MADSITLDTKNVEILEEFFEDLSHVNKRGIFLSAFKKASVPFVAMIKNNVSLDATDRGNLWRSIGTKAVPGQIALWVGSILKTKYITKSGKVSNVWYGRLTEGGAHNVGRRPKGMNRKSMKSSGKGGTISARHWFSGAWDWSQYQVYEAIDKEWYDAINRMIVRMNKKQIRYNGR